MLQSGAGTISLCDSTGQHAPVGGARLPDAAKLCQPLHGCVGHGGAARRYRTHGNLVCFPHEANKQKA